MNVGLHKEEYERTNALSSADAEGGRLRRIVRTNLLVAWLKMLLDVCFFAKCGKWKQLQQRQWRQ